MSNGQWVGERSRGAASPPVVIPDKREARRSGIDA